MAWSLNLAMHHSHCDCCGCCGFNRVILSFPAAVTVASAVGLPWCCSVVAIDCGDYFDEAGGMHVCCQPFRQDRRARQIAGFLITNAHALHCQTMRLSAYDNIAEPHCL